MLVEDSCATTVTATLDELLHEVPERIVALLLNVMSAHWGWVSYCMRFGM